MTIMKSEPLSEALNFPKKGEMLRGVKVLDAKSKFRSPIFEYQITFPKGTKTKDIPAMLKQFFNTQIVNADKNYMVTHHDYRVKPFEGNVCVVGSMQLIEMIRTNPSVKLQEFDKHYSEMEMTNPETFFRKFKCASFNSPQFRAQLFSYVSYMGENYGYSIDGCIYHRRASLIMPKIKITKAIPQAKMMYHTHPSKDEPSLSSADDYLLYFDLSHKPRNIRHFYTVMKDRMDYFQITPKKDSKADYVKLSEDKIIDEINAELDDLEERWAEKIPKDTGHANDMKFCENITRDLVKWINKKYKNYFKVKYTCYHRVRKNPETLEADDLHLGDEFIAKALNDIKTGEYSWPTFNSSAMPHEKYAYWHQMYYDHHVRDSFMTLGVNMPPGSDRRMNYYLQSKAPESAASYTDLLNILNISHDIAASDSKITDGGKVNSRIAEVARYLELPTNVIDDLKLLEEIIYTMDVFSEEAKTLAGDYYGIVLLANYSINAIGIMNQVHNGKLDLTIAKQDVYHNLKMRTQEALSSFFVQKNRQDGIRINPAITIAKLELVTQFPREAFDYFDIVEEALAQFSKSRIDPTRSFYVKNTKMMYLSVPTSKGSISMNLSYGTGKAQIFATKVDDPMEAAMEAVNKVGMALYRNGAQGIDPNEFSINVATPLMNPQPKVIIISGPSGAGKSTTIRNLLRRLPNAKTAPSYTTRQPRKSDKPGEKVFLSKEKFVKKLESGDMIAARLQKNGHYYGRLRSDFDHSGYVIVDVNLSGLQDIKREFPKALTAYLEPVEDPKFIERRLLMRGDMSPQEARKRSSIIPSHIASSKKINFDLRIKTRQGHFNEASDKILETLPRSNPDNTKQGKLPKELTEGADVSELSADDWFTKEGKKKLDKKRKAKQTKQAKDDEDEHSESKQTRLFEEARAQGIEDATEIVEEEIEDNPRNPKDCPPATQDLALNTKNRDAAVKAEHIQYGPLNLNDKDYWTRYGKRWNTSAAVAKKSNCSNCIAFDISPRMKDCMPGKTSDKDGELGYCWMHHFKCHSARTCYTWAAGGPISKDKVSSEWQDRAFPKSNPNTPPFAVFVVGKVGDKYTATTRDDGRIGLPGGKVDPGESGEVAAMREATEEGWSFPAGTSLTLIHQQDVDGNPVEWYMADTTPSPLSEYKEKYRGIRPILITAEQLKASGFGNENLPLYNPKKTPEGRKIPKRYLKGLNKEEMAIAAKEIDKGYKYDINDPKAYEYWKSDIKATARGYKTVPSKYKKKFIEMYGPLPEKGEFLDKMAKATKIKKSILQKVYDKGLAAWRGGHRPGVQQHQWAAGRVYSFVTLGNTVKKGNKKMPDHSLAIKAGLIKDNPRGELYVQDIIDTEDLGKIMKQYEARLRYLLRKKKDPGMEKQRKEKLAEIRKQFNWKGRTPKSLFEAVADTINKETKLKPVVKVYRGMIGLALGEEETLGHMKQYGTGPFWSTRKESADIYVGGSKFGYTGFFGAKSILLEGEARITDVYWPDTFRSRLSWPEEHELELMNSIKLTSVKIYSIDDRARDALIKWETTGKNWKPWIDPRFRPEVTYKYSKVVVPVDKIANNPDDDRTDIMPGITLSNPSDQEVIEAGYLQGVNDVIDIVEDETEDPDSPDLVVHGDIYNFQNATIERGSRLTVGDRVSGAKTAGDYIGGDNVEGNLARDSAEQNNTRVGGNLATDKAEQIVGGMKADRASNIQTNPSRSKPTLEQFRKWVELVNMKNKELKAFLDSDWFKESGLTPAQAKAQGIKSGQDSFRSIIRMRKKLGLTGPKDYIKEGPQITNKYYEMALDKWSGPDNKVSALDDRTDWGWMMRQIRFNSRASAFPYNKAAEGRKGPLVKKQKTQNQPSRKLLSLWVWGHDPWRWARKHGVESMPKCPKVPWVGMTEKRKYGSIPVIMSPKTKKNPGHCPIEVEARRAASDPSFKHHEWYIEHHLNYVMAIAKAIVKSDEPEDQQLIHDMVWMHDYPKMMGDNDNFELVRELVSKHRSERYTDRLMNQLRWMEEIKSLDWSGRTTTIAAVMSTADALAHYYGPFWQIYMDENKDKDLDFLKKSNAAKLEKDKRKLRAGPMTDGLDSVKFQYKGRKVRVVGNEHIADLVTRKNPSDWRHGKFSEEDPFEEYFEE